MILLYVFAGILACIGVGIAWRQVELRRLRHRRGGSGFTRERFIETFSSVGVPTSIPGAVFDYYASRGVWKNFPFSPDDAYSRVLYDDPQDIEEDARTLVERLNMLFPAEYVLREHGDKPIKTLRDMVLWLDWVRQHQPGGQSAARLIR